MTRDLFYVIAGYLMGSILFARVSGRLLHCGNPAEHAPDKNPGTFNAFENGGFACGLLTLAGDILKSLLPVWMYTALGKTTPAGMILVMAAPVVGHIFPAFFRFQGGKGIASTFGVLLALLPEWRPLGILAACFLFFSLVVRISPNYYRTLLTYFCAEILMLILVPYRAVQFGFTLIVLAVLFRLWRSQEEKGTCKVGLLWMH